MLRSIDPSTDDGDEFWRTWEDLLLTCAVARHGPHRWDSVAGEIRSRSRSPLAFPLTADACRRRYRLLCRRFAAADADGEIPWLDDLRKLRVAELRSELQRHDDSIGSLQSKVRELEEERDRSLRDEAAAADGLTGSGSGSGSDPIAGGDVSCNESVAESKRGDEEISAVGEVVDLESKPLIDFLEMIRKNENASVFEWRLNKQDNARYHGLVRRHMDLDVVQNKIGKNGYTSTEFFRDMLLLCNNALVFYPKNSSESIAAVHLRDVINKKIASNLHKTAQLSIESKEEPKIDLVPLDKPDSRPSLVACLKQSTSSTSTAKPAKPVKKVEKEEDAEEEEVVDTRSKRSMRTNKTRAGLVATPKPKPIEAKTHPRGASKLLNRIKTSSGLSSEEKVNVEKLRRPLVKHREENKKNAKGSKKSNVGRPPTRATPAKRGVEDKAAQVTRKRAR